MGWRNGCRGKNERVREGEIERERGVVVEREALQMAIRLGGFAYDRRLERTADGKSAIQGLTLQTQNMFSTSLALES